MKKIIELAEKYCDSAYSDDEALAQLEFVLHERRVLEQTPITEDWLKEHGFKNERLGTWSNIRRWKDCDNFTHTVGASVSSQNIYNTMEGELSLIVNADSKGYLAKSINTLADLYDACSLCGINLEV